jgi:hypothetical protein
VGGFFSGTLKTMQGSHLRPRDAWWPGYQEAAGEVLADLLRRRKSPSTIHHQLSVLLDAARSEHKQEVAP